MKNCSCGAMSKYAYIHYNYSIVCMIVIGNVDRDISTFKYFCNANIYATGKKLFEEQLVSLC